MVCINRSLYGTHTLKKIVIQIIAAIMIFNLVSIFKESSLLDSSGELAAPYFYLPLLNKVDEKVSLAEFKDQKTVIYFFAPWCSICRVSMPNLQNKVTDGSLNAIAIALDFDSQEQVTEFTKDLGISFPVLLGNHQVRQNYQIKAYPTYYVIDENLKISGRSMAYSTELGLAIRGS